MAKKVISLFFLVLSDILVIFISFWLAYFIRNEFLPQIFPRFSTVNLVPLSTFFNHFYMVIVWIFIFAYEKLYIKRFPFWAELKVLLKSITLSFALIMIMIFLTRKQIQFSRTIVILAWVLSLFLFPLFRFITKYSLARLNIWKKKLLILGVQQTSLSVVRSIKNNITMGYEVFGFLDNDPEKIGKKFQGVKVLGYINDLDKIIKNLQFKDIMITIPLLPRKELKELLSKSESVSNSMWLIPRSGDFITEGIEIEVIGQVLTLYIKKNLAKPWNIFAKAVFDKILIIILIILFLPIFFLVAIAIALDSKGPVIFIQKRIGQGRKPFNVFKFRSMYSNSDKKLHEYLNNHPEAKKEWEKFKKLRHSDPRVTKVGKIIRKFSLDELPQFFNVLIGNMSLVGPRPYLAEELKGKESFIRQIIRVKPGITGLWQVSGRSELSFEERNALDEYYIRNWSLWLDISILIRSMIVHFSSKGAF